jgi:hypothetical protein
LTEEEEEEEEDDDNDDFFMVQRPPVGQGLLITEASQTHLDTPHSVRLLWTSDRRVAETST